MAGQEVALVGTTGTDAFHLHFEVRTSDQQIIDPFGCAATVQVADPDACIGYLWSPISAIFSDGFEPGDTSNWTQTVP